MDKIKDVPDLVRYLEVLKEMVDRQVAGAAARGRGDFSSQFGRGKAQGLDEAIRAAKQLLPPQPTPPHAPQQSDTITSHDPAA